MVSFNPVIPSGPVVGFKFAFTLISIAVLSITALFYRLASEIGKVSPLLFLLVAGAVEVACYVLLRGMM